MNKFSIFIEKIQHIQKIEFSINIEQNGLMVIIGKNGVGKTLLFKGIQNLITSNTFDKTSNKYIYHEDSKITYEVDEKSYVFTYNKDVKTLDYKGNVDENIVKNIYVELSIPFGERFKQFKKLGLADSEIRRSIVAKQYQKPVKLIELLNYIYDTDRFDNLKEVNIKNDKYYVIVLENYYYIREDYLSSGEYFILNIYKLIEKRCRFIAIDEIDISLDAMAQVRFVKILRELAEEYKIKLFFSTHSLALIKTLKDGELFYMSLDEGVCSFEEKPYSYIKEQLYGFRDYKKERDDFEAQISKARKPLIITEGKTDWKHFKAALEFYNNKGKFTTIDVDFLEYESDMGDSQLDKLLREISRIPRENKVIGIFDCDTPIGKKYEEEKNQIFPNEVYGITIPVPSFREYHIGICVEFLYQDIDLKREDSHARRIYLSEEFTDKGRLIDKRSIVIGNANVIKRKNNRNMSIIIDNDVIDEEDNNIALSKNDFALNILSKENSFLDIDFSGFEALFEKIDTIIN